MQSSGEQDQEVEFLRLPPLLLREKERVQEEAKHNEVIDDLYLSRGKHKTHVLQYEEEKVYEIVDQFSKNKTSPNEVALHQTSKNAQQSESNEDVALPERKNAEVALPEPEPPVAPAKFFLDFLAPPPAAAADACQKTNCSSCNKKEPETRVRELPVCENCPCANDCDAAFCFDWCDHFEEHVLKHGTFGLPADNNEQQ